jgi:hypothetical protein
LLVVAAVAGAGCFSGTNAAVSSTTQGTLTTVAISVDNPVATVLDAGTPLDTDPTDAVPEQGSCTVEMNVRPLAATTPDTASTDDTASTNDAVEVIEWTGSGGSSGFAYGGWLTEAAIAAIEAEGLVVDRAQFNLSCVGGGGRVVSLVGTNLIPQRAADYPLRLAATGGQSVRDKILLNVSTVADDVSAPRTSIWALAEPATLRITTLDAGRIVASITAELISFDTERTATLNAQFDFSNG